MSKIFLPFLCVILFSCHGFHSPTNKEIEEAVINIYNKRNETDGSKWQVREVKVIKSRKGDDERHYNIQVSVKGAHTVPPQAIPKPDEEFDESKEIKLIWRGGKWIEDNRQTL